MENWKTGRHVIPFTCTVAQGRPRSLRKRGSGKAMLLVVGCVVATVGIALACLLVPFHIAAAQTLSNITFGQITWFGSQSPTITNSEWGEFAADITPGLSRSNVNVLASTGGSIKWIVRNLPTIPSAGDPATQRFVTLFDLRLLGIARGTDISSIMYRITIDPSPRTTDPPPGSMEGPVIVSDVAYDAEGRSPGPVIDPGPPHDLDSLDFNVGFVTTTWQPAFPNIDLDNGTRPGERNGCGPAAASNSLKWLGTPGTLRNIFNEISTDMGRAPGATITDNQFLNGKLRYIKDKALGLGIKFQDDLLGGANYQNPARPQDGTAEAKGTTPTFEFIRQELEAGEDVEVGMTYDGGGGHWVTAAGVIDLGLIRGVWTKDDADQERAGGTKTRFGWLRTRNDGFLELKSFARNKIDIVVSESPKPKCSNGVDDDADGCADYPTDLGCTDASDNSEAEAGCAACSDGVDNDGNGCADYPDDPGCQTASDNDESRGVCDGQPQCSDGIDNDGDGYTDYPSDPGCTSPQDDCEADAGCVPALTNWGVAVLALCLCLGGALLLVRGRARMLR